MRFVYCAASICTFIDSFDGIDTEKMVEYILKSQTYEGKEFYRSSKSSWLGYLGI